MVENKGIFEAREKLLGELGWTENPFIKDLRIYDKQSFLNYYCPLDGEKVLERLAFDAKACILVGPKGVGKTSALYYAYYQLPGDEFRPVMLKQPPATLTELAAEMGLKKQETVGEAIYYSIAGLAGVKKPKKDVSRRELVEFLRGSGKKIVLFVDEAHLVADHGTYMEYKYLLDEVPNLRIVFSTLSAEGMPDSLLHLVGDGNVLSRKGFSTEEMHQIIAHRIESVGGKGTHPFSKGALEEAFTDHNLLTPRYAFDELNRRLAEMAVGKRNLVQEANRLGAGDEIVKAAVEATREGKAGSSAPTVTGGGKLTKVHADWWVSLSPSQQGVMQLLLEHGEGLTLHEVCQAAGLAENTAFNALYQLRGEDGKELERKKNVPFPLVDVEARMVGGRKKNLYHVAEKVRNLFTVS